MANTQYPLAEILRLNVEKARVKKGEILRVTSPLGSLPQLREALHRKQGAGGCLFCFVGVAVGMNLTDNLTGPPSIGI